jgi:hypothetical protein
MAVRGIQVAKNATEVLKSIERTDMAVRGIKVAKSASERFLEDRDGC